MKLTELMAVPADGVDVLGKVVYYTLGNILVEKQALASLCMSVGLEYKPASRPAVADAFQSATSDVHKRLVTRDGTGATQICKVYFRDNVKTHGLLSRELVKETLDSSTNQYTKLANVTVDKSTGVFEIRDLMYDDQVDAKAYCDKASALFTLYQACAGRRQVEGLLDKFLDGMDAVKICRGKFYFVPRNQMQRLGRFEDLAAALSEQNLIQSRRSPDDPQDLDVLPTVDTNTMFVVDDQKQRGKMANAFYIAVGKEIEDYEECIQRLIQNNCGSEKIAQRWMDRVSALTAKKRRYEDILQQQLDKTKDDFNDLLFMAQELQIQARRKGQPLPGQLTMRDAA